MNAETPKATRDDSRSTPDSRVDARAATVARLLAIAAGAIGVVALVLATFLPVIEITVAQGVEITADLDRSLSGYDRHSVALVLIAGVAGAMLAGAVLRSSRPAMLAVAALGTATLLIAVVADAPDLDQVGAIGDLYEEASAGPGSGFYVETLGGALLLLSGGGLLLLSGSGATGGWSQPARTRRTRSRPARRAPAPPAPTPDAAEADDLDWEEPVPRAARRPTPAPAEPVAVPEPSAAEPVAAPQPSAAEPVAAPEPIATEPVAPAPAEAQASPGRSPAAAPADRAGMSFDDRLREARERAARRRGE